MSETSTIMPSPYKENIRLAPHTTMRVGGPARYFTGAKTLVGLERALAFAAKRDLPVFILGGGSNIVVADEGFPGLVIKLGMDGISFQDYPNDRALVVAAAGVSWDDLVRRAVDRGLWGLENLSHIPGTVGAAPVQNIGAYGAEVADTLAWIKVYDPRTKKAYTLTNHEAGFSYRDSIFKRDDGKRLVILEAAFVLKREGTPNTSYRDLSEHFAGKTPSLSELRAAVIAIRSRKFPPLSTHGTAGSFFKNPVIAKGDYQRLARLYPGLPQFPTGERVKVPLAWILDRVCGWKGFRKGHVGTYGNQPLVIVNYHDATASEIRMFAKAIEDDVFHRTKIKIEPEVLFVG